MRDCEPYIIHAPTRIRNCTSFFSLYVNKPQDDTYYFNLFLNKSNPIRCCKFQPFPFFVTHFIISNAYVLSLKIPSKKWKLFISDYNCSFSIRDIRWSSGWKTSHTTFFLIIKKSNLRKMVWIEAVEMYNSRGLKPLPRKYPF